MMMQELVSAHIKWYCNVYYYLMCFINILVPGTNRNNMAEKGLTKTALHVYTHT